VGGFKGEGGVTEWFGEALEGAAFRENAKTSRGTALLLSSGPLKSHKEAGDPPSLDWQFKGLNLRQGPKKKTLRTVLDV